MVFSYISILFPQFKKGATLLSVYVNKTCNLKLNETGKNGESINQTRLHAASSKSGKALRISISGYLFTSRQKSVSLFFILRLRNL